MTARLSVPSDPQIVLTNEVPLESRNLIWATFFESRNRGLSLEVHFPWINDPSSSYCLTIYDEVLGQQKTAVAALVLKVIQTEGGDSFGLIGLVCVATKFRRQGLCNKLLASAVEVGTDRHWNGLILWTQKPEVYFGHGFVVVGRELFGTVEGQSTIPKVTAISQTEWPTPADIRLLRGLPPFATAAVEYSQDENRVVVLQTPSGPTVAEWDGDATAILRILEQVMPRKWFLNAYSDDAVFELLASQGMKFELIAATSRMTKSLSAQVPSAWPKVGILDRI